MTYIKPEFAAVIRDWASNSHIPELFRLSAENLLMEKRLNSERWESYQRNLAPCPNTTGEWQNHHRKYVKNSIELSADDFPLQYDPSNRTQCPETFLNSQCLVSISEDTELLHVEKAQYLVQSATNSYAASYGEPLTVEILRSIIADFQASRAVGSRDKITLILAAWRDSRLRRTSLAPIFAACSADLPTVSINEGCQIRDRLGITSFSGQPDKLLWIVAWKYPASIIPTMKSSQAAASAPTAIDFDLYDAFCPIPKPNEYGRAMWLGNTTGGDLRVRELVHAVPEWQPEHLLGCLSIDCQPPPLEPSRKSHLAWIQTL